MRIPRRSFFVEFRNARQKWQIFRYSTGSLPPFETPTKEEQGTTHQFAICGEIMNTDKALSTPDFETEINFDCILSPPIATAFRWNTVTTFARF